MIVPACLPHYGVYFAAVDLADGAACEFLPGWYYLDAAGLPVGPYSTERDARFAAHAAECEA